jgi:hypothetical protein
MIHTLITFLFRRKPVRYRTIILLDGEVIQIN